MELKNNLNVVKMDGVATSLIPIKEREINDVVPAGSEALAQDIAPVLTISENAMDALIPEDERGLDELEDEKDVYAEAECQGYVSPVSKMGRIDSYLDVPMYGCIEKMGRIRG